MKVVLDESFPLGLVRVLEADGVYVEYLITLGWRGASDSRIRTRLSSPEVLFLTQDEDFGDDWAHLLVHEGMKSAEASLNDPRCVAGARRCPPENCGGVRGYVEFLGIIGNPKHSEHASMMQWADGDYDPDAFDPEGVVFENPRNVGRSRSNSNHKSHQRSRPGIHEPAPDWQTADPWTSIQPLR